MTYRNAQFKNTGNDEGDVLSFFEDKMRNLIQRNGGDHTFSFVTEDFHDKDCPMAIGTKTHMKLTHTGHTISQIEKGFVSMKVKILLRLSEAVSVADDAKQCLRLFVGFKNAVEIFESARFENGTRQIENYNQDELIRESFAYNSIKPAIAKGNSRFSSTTWENVKDFSYSVCGKYIPLTELADGNEHQFELDLIIPFSDQLALQAWQLYPNRICGEIEEEVKTSLAALVWCMVPYDGVASTIEKQSGVPIGYVFNGNSANKLLEPTRKFVQIGQQSLIVNGFTKVGGQDQTANNINVTTKKISLLCSGGVIESAQTNLAGFGLKTDVHNALFNLLRTPIMVPAQELTREHFEGSASANGLNVTRSIALHNAIERVTFILIHFIYFIHSLAFFGIF